MDLENFKKKSCILQYWSGITKDQNQMGQVIDKQNKTKLAQLIKHKNSNSDITCTFMHQSTLNKPNLILQFIFVDHHTKGFPGMVYAPEFGSLTYVSIN